MELAGVGGAPSTFDAEDNITSAEGRGPALKMPILFRWQLILAMPTRSTFLLNRSNAPDEMKGGYSLLQVQRRQDLGCRGLMLLKLNLWLLYAWVSQNFTGKPDEGKLQVRFEEGALVVLNFCRATRLYSTQKIKFIKLVK